MAKRRADKEDLEQEAFPQAPEAALAAPCVDELKPMLSPREKYREALNNAIDGAGLGDVKVVLNPCLSCMNPDSADMSPIHPIYHRLIGMGFYLSSVSPAPQSHTTPTIPRMHTDLAPSPQHDPNPAKV